MKTVLLNGKKMTSKKEIHLYLKRKLNCPSYYGNNLDALWDILITASEKLNVILFNKEYLDEYLGEYGDSLIDVFKEAGSVNSNINFRIARIRIRL
ncbi:barstar [Tissierella creatinini]|nr:barstar [Tissierella creatinini]TJX65098.1 barstar [Soehngenia saccharolytica]